MLKATDVVARAVHICKIPKVDYEIAQALLVNRLQAEQLVKTWMAGWKQLSGSNSVTVTSAMTSDEGKMLQGIIEMDETYVGGKPRYRNAGNKDSRYPDGTPVTNVAAWNEFGTSRGIPERPFFRLAIAGAEDGLLALLKRELDPKTLAIDQQLADRVGVDSQASTVLDRHVPSSDIVDARALGNTPSRRIWGTSPSAC